MLGEDAARVDAVGEHVGVDLVGDQAPLVGEALVAAPGGEPGGAVERDPAHDLAADVVVGLAAHLPDALVGPPPDLGRAARLVLDHRPEPRRVVAVLLLMQVDRVEDGAVDVVLALVEGAVADPDGPRPLVAGQVVERLLLELASRRRSRT